MRIGLFKLAVYQLKPIKPIILTYISGIFRVYIDFSTIALAYALNSPFDV